jgi:thioredoxin 1
MAMAENMITLTDANFESEVTRKGAGPILVDFWSTSCPPCKVVAPHLDKLAEEYKGQARIGKMDVDENPIVPTKYGIMSIPTLFLFKDGKVAEQIVGAQSKETIAAMIRRNI